MRCSTEGSADCSTYLEEKEMTKKAIFDDYIEKTTGRVKDTKTGVFLIPGEKFHRAIRDPAVNFIDLYDSKKSHLSDMETNDCCRLEWGHH